MDKNIFNRGVGASPLGMHLDAPPRRRILDTMEAAWGRAPLVILADRRP